MNERKRTLQELIEETISFWTVRGHASATISNYRQVFSMLLSFCAKNGIDEYSETVGDIFIAAKRNQAEPVCRAGIHRYASTIRKLNCVLNNVEFAPEPRERFVNPTSRYDSMAKAFENYLRQTGKTEVMIRRHSVIAARFLKYLEDNGCLRINDLTVSLIYKAFEDAPGINKYPFRAAVSGFLKYAHTYGLIDADYSRTVPSVVRHSAVASVYTPEEVETLLESIDRSDECGKRDYAIILLAARLGLRASDIAALTRDNLKLEKGAIEVIQRKTKTPHSVPLTDEIKDAVFDYINNGRPVSEAKQIFINKHGYGAIRAGNIGDIARRRFLSARIDCGTRRTGSHSLRSSLATAMLAEGTDYHTIQKALGHLDIQSTKIYAKTDVDKLRINALPVPQSTGIFETLLSNGGIRP